MNEKFEEYSDTHSHLNFPDFDTDRVAVINRARASCCSLIVNIGSGMGIKGNYESIQIAERYPFIYSSVGIHPHDADEVGGSVPELLKMMHSKRVIAVGEIGLDFYRLRSSKEKQKSVFVEQLRIAKEQGFPIIIHSRNAMKDTIEILEMESAWKNRVIFHCFSGDKNDAEFILKNGGYISFAGNITYRKDGPYNYLLSDIPDTRILLETDCPYLTPVPFRGRRNEPAFIPKTGEFIAKVKGLTLQDILRITLVNAHLAFRIKRRFEPKIAYKIRNSLYLNITNRCTNDCTFCGKRKSWFVKGHYLKLEKEPSVQEIMQKIDEERDFSEIVFCGYGEPLLRLDVVREVAGLIKKNKNIKVRIDTDGLANLVHKRNILPELAGLVDSISISLNAPSAFIYEKLCPSDFGEPAFHSLLKFIKDAKKYIKEVTATAVELPGVSMEDVRVLANSLGASFRKRRYDDLG